MVGLGDVVNKPSREKGRKCQFGKDHKVTKKDGSSLDGKPGTPAKPADAKP